MPSVEELVAALEEWATVRGFDAALRAEVERFRDYCLGKIDPKSGYIAGTRKVLYADFAAGCRKWITNPEYGHPGRPPSRASPDGKGGDLVAAQPPRTRRNIGVIERFVGRGDDG